MMKEITYMRSKVESHLESVVCMYQTKYRINEFLISEPKQLLNYATKEVSKIVQASFDSLLIFVPQKFPILKEISI